MSLRNLTARLLPLAIGLCLFLAPGRGTACLCEGPPSAIAALLRSDAVFEGVVIDIADEDFYIKGSAGEFDWPQARVTLRVLRSWKGVSVGEVTLVTDRGGASCGFPFETGGHYLVFAKRYRGRLTTDICSRTRLMTTAHGELRDLGPPRWQGAP